MPATKRPGRPGHPESPVRPELPAARLTVQEPSATYATRAARATQPAPAAEPPPTTRQVRLFRNGANQAVRIPREFELPGQEVRMYRDGDKLVLEPVKPTYERGTPEALLAALEEMARLGPITDTFPDVDEGLLPLDDIILEAPEHD